MARTGGTGTASPKAMDKKSDNIQKQASALGRELGGLFLMKQTMSLYNGLKKSNKWTEGLANTVEGKANSLCEDIIGTKIGKKADESLASAAATTKKIVECFVCRQDKEDSCHHSAIAMAVMKVFHLCFRFFLPLLLFRWSVDAALACTELALALTKDFVRSGSTAVHLSVEGLKEFEDTTEKQPEKERSDETSKAPQAVNYLFSSWWDVITYFVSLDYYMTKFFAIFFAIPYLTYQWYFLNAISCILHRLAGLDYDEQDNKTTQQRPTMALENTFPKERKLRFKQWLADSVLNRIISQLLDTPLLGLFLEMAGVKRQFNLFKKLQKALRGSVLSLRENGVPSGLLSAMADIGRFVEGDLTPYLNLDTYNEEEDPDYETGDSSEDSMDSEDKHLEATNRKDDIRLKHEAERAKVLAKDGQSPSPRERRDTVSLDHQDAQPSSRCIPDAEPSGRLEQEDRSEDSKERKDSKSDSSEGVAHVTRSEEKSTGDFKTANVNIALDKQNPKVALSPLQQKQRDDFLSCITKITNPEFAKELADSLEWAILNTDGIGKVTAVLKKNPDEDECGASAVKASPETCDRFALEWSVGSPPEYEEVDPDIAALLTSGAPLDIVSVRAGEIFTSSPDIEALAPGVGEDLFDVDPANHPLPPSPAPELSPLGKVRRHTWRSQRSGWQAHLVDTIDEEDEQVWRDEARCKDDVFSTEETNIKQMDQLVIETKKDQLVEEVFDAEQESQETDRKVEVTEGINLEPQTDPDAGQVTIRALSSSVEMPCNNDFGDENQTLHKKTEDEKMSRPVSLLPETLTTKDFIKDVESVVTKSSISNSRKNREIHVEQSSGDTDFHDVAHRLPYQEIHQKVETEANISTNYGKDNSVNSDVASESFPLAKENQCVVESVSSPVSSLSSLSSYDENERKSNSEVRQLAPGSDRGGMVRDSGRSSTCTDVDTGLASTAQARGDYQDQPASTMSARVVSSSSDEFEDAIDLNANSFASYLD
ncbi:hypothetical protein RRG08_002325 [Elysia crispata]|uniref:Uncharacterized protein n=1 Tax=Elysia crispata TaxID=231223 RepID=A0AAE1DE62_9GAST|nr:hypothetical protein RRG08_002325 [Elysia crispata]